MWIAIIIIVISVVLLFTTVVSYARGKGKDNDSNYDPHSGGGER